MCAVRCADCAMSGGMRGGEAGSGAAYGAMGGRKGVLERTRYVLRTACMAGVLLEG